MKFQMLGEPVDLEKLFHREATEPERRLMLGSLATVYEMKVPLLHVLETGTFYNFQVLEDVTVNFMEEGELVILQSEFFLPSLYKKPAKKIRKK